MPHQHRVRFGWGIWPTLTASSSATGVPGAPVPRLTCAAITQYFFSSSAFLFIASPAASISSPIPAVVLQPTRVTRDEPNTASSKSSALNFEPILFFMRFSSAGYDSLHNRVISIPLCHTRKISKSRARPGVARSENSAQECVMQTPAVAYRHNQRRKTPPTVSFSRCNRNRRFHAWRVTDSACWRSA